MMPWTGTDAWRSWWVTAWDVMTTSSLVNCGTGFGWWLAQEDTTGRRLNVSRGWHRETHCLPQFLTWWWMQWCVNSFFGGNRSRRAGQVGKGGATPRRIFLHRSWPGSINRLGLVAGRFWHPDRVVQLGGDLEKLQEGGQDDLTPLPCSGELIVGSLIMEDEGRGSHIP